MSSSDSRKAIKPKGDQKYRTCLCCGNPFKSTGPGNRCCKTCANKRKLPP